MEIFVLLFYKNKYYLLKIGKYSNIKGYFCLIQNKLFFKQNHGEGIFN